MRGIRSVGGLVVVGLVAMTVACGGGSENDLYMPGSPVGLNYDATALPTDAQMRSFSGAYRLEITLSKTRCPGMPLQTMTFDVVMGRSLDNYPQGAFRGLPNDPFDAGQVAVRPEGLAIRFGNALIVGTPYVVRSSLTWPREGRFEISGGRGRFVAGKMDLPNFEIVGLGPDGNYRVRPDGNYEIWRCDAVDHGVTFLPLAPASAELTWLDRS